MRTIKATKVVNPAQLYDEIVAAVPELAPTPTGPDGKLEAQFIIEQASSRTVLLHVPDEVDTKAVGNVVAAHKRGPERTVDPRGDALALIEQRAAEGDELAQAVLKYLA